MKTFSAASLEPQPVSAPIRSICERDGLILLGCHGSEIYEVQDSSIPFAGTSYVSHFLVILSHKSKFKSRKSSRRES